MLEHARPGERAVLGDVPDEQHRDAAGAWRPRRSAPRPRGPAPTDPGALVELARVERLDRVDHADLGTLALEHREHRSRSVSATAGTASAPPPSRCAAQPHLRGRLLARDVERAMTGGREVAEHHVRQRRLADPRRRRRAAPPTRARCRRRARGRARRCRSAGAGPRRASTSASATGSRHGAGRPLRPNGDAVARPPRTACSTRRTPGSARASAAPRGRRRCRRELVRAMAADSTRWPGQDHEAPGTVRGPPERASHTDGAGARRPAQSVGSSSSSTTARSGASLGVIGLGLRLALGAAGTDRDRRLGLLGLDDRQPHLARLALGRRVDDDRRAGRELLARGRSPRAGPRCSAGSPGAAGARPSPDPSPSRPAGPWPRR